MGALPAWIEKHPRCHPVVKPRDDRDETDPRRNNTEDVFRSTLAMPPRNDRITLHNTTTKIYVAKI
ncbi:hypothetical protein RBEAN4_1307 [Rickettsia bellii str. RML An4]|uniref:Uncharacterized protein n=1 Tax=Rickettsia bellii str. RML An4 TaxID=1359193 RepID=A0A0F3QFV1_RICBE|nr:hypothetical protein RBEAN4_1307 [Rickettsia bellii str. RML An4]